MKPLRASFIIILFLCFVSFAHGEDICSESAQSGCTIDDGKLTLGPLETSAYIAAAEDDVCIVYFYSETCSHCKAVKPLIDSLDEKFKGKVHLTRYDVSSPENIKLYNQLCQARGYDGKSIPLIGINDVILVGEEQIREHLEEEILKGIDSPDKICPLGGDMGCHLTNSSGQPEKNSTDSLIPGLQDISFGSVLPVIIVSGLGDGINPCAFIILVFVMVFLQQISSSKKKLLKISFTYAFALFLTNVLLGALYYSISLKLGFPDFIRWAVIIISFLAGAINIKDYFWYGKGITLGVPAAAKSYLKSLIDKASVPSAFILGVSVAILEAPCSVPIYLAVIEVLKGEGTSLIAVMPHIIIYNIMFIIPLIAIALFVYFTQKAEVIEKRSLDAKRWMKLGMGIILVLLGFALLFGWL